MKLRDHSSVNQVSIDHQSDLYGVSGEGQNVGECTHCNRGSDMIRDHVERRGVGLWGEEQPLALS